MSKFKNDKSNLDFDGIDNSKKLYQAQNVIASEKNIIENKKSIEKPKENDLENSNQFAQQYVPAKTLAGRVSFKDVDKFGIQALVKNAFDLYDADNSGYLEKDEIRCFLNDIFSEYDCENVTEDDIDYV